MENYDAHCIADRDTGCSGDVLRLLTGTRWKVRGCREYRNAVTQPKQECSNPKRKTTAALPVQCRFRQQDRGDAREWGRGCTSIQSWGPGEVQPWAQATWCKAKGLHSSGRRAGPRALGMQDVRWGLVGNGGSDGSDAKVDSNRRSQGGGGGTCAPCVSFSPSFLHLRAALRRGVREGR